jgi:hypothetical protein
MPDHATNGCRNHWGTGIMIWLRSVIVSMLLVMAATVNAQAVGRMRLFVEAPGGDVVGAEPRTYRLYETPDHLTLKISLELASGDAVRITPGDMSRLVRFSLQSEPQLPLVANWDPQVRFDGSRQLVAPGADVRMDVGRSSEWVVTLRRRDQQIFEARRYTVVIAFPEGLRGSRSDDGRPWNGHLFGSQMTISLVVGPPSGDLRERTAALRQAGRVADANNQPDEALRTYQAALAIDPKDSRALLAMGDLYLRVRRYSDAITALQPLARTPTVEKSPVPYMLARAYLAVGDEANAVLTLRNAGIPAGQIQSNVQDLRETNRREAQRGRQ